MKKLYLSVAFVFIGITSSLFSQNTLDIDDRIVTIVSTEEASNYGSDATAKSGNVMLAINVKIQGKKVENYSSVMASDFELVDSKGKKFYTKYKHDKAPLLKYTTLSEGLTVEGWIVFEVPVGYKSLGLTLTMKQIVTTTKKHNVISIK